ncbi:MAG: TolC family protein [Planctomycetales bacterium]|nr:TolC family protein [Planctomycetales bacterium]
MSTIPTRFVASRRSKRVRTDRQSAGDRLERVFRHHRVHVWLWLVALALLPVAATGCRGVSSQGASRGPATSPLASYSQLRIEVPAENEFHADDLGAELPPVTLSSWESGSVEFWDLTIEDAIRIGLERSQVFRDLGGVVLSAPSASQTVFDPAITETDPNYGVEGALSAFDAQWSTALFVEKNDRALNNQFFGGGARILRQDLAEYNSELSKRTATGALLTVRNIAEYDFNNAPANLFTNGAWTLKLETEARQPLLQGRGVDFNRIAGPNGSPGFNQGVLIARVNADVALADFEQAVRNLVQDIETAYWELYFGYRDLDAKADSRDRALATWRRIQSLADTGQRGGEASREAQARAQFYRQQEEVQNAFAGTAQDKARTIAFRGTGGVLQNERRLRLLLNLPAADGTVIRPADEPLVTELRFSWNETVDEALARRVELRRQRWEMKRRELELVAARNYLLPRLDLVGRYRWRGFGHELIDTPGGNGDFDNALEDLISGDYTEVQMGVEYRFPIGFRQAHANHRQAQLALARERAVLEAQERDVLTELTNAVSELDRAYTTLATNLERREAHARQLEALETVYEDDTTDESNRLRLLDLILDAQRNLAEAESRCYRGQVEFQLAVRQVHYAKGSLLEYNGIVLNEGAWSREAIESSREQARRRRTMPNLVSYMMPARRLSNGPIADSWESPIMESELIPELSEPPVEATEDPSVPTVPAEDTSADASRQESDSAPARRIEPITPGSTETTPSLILSAEQRPAEVMFPRAVVPRTATLPMEFRAIAQEPLAGLIEPAQEVPMPSLDRTSPRIMPLAPSPVFPIVPAQEPNSGPTVTPPLNQPRSTAPPRFEPLPTVPTGPPTPQATPETRNGTRLRVSG